MKLFEDEKKYDDYVSKVRPLLENLYSHERYLRKLKKFYKEEYDFIPEPGSSPLLIRKILALCDKNIEKSNEEIALLRTNLFQARKRNSKLEADLENLLASTSWKITKPLRRFGAKRIIK